MGSGDEAFSFGNEVDFFNQPFAVTQVGFQVYNVSENFAGGPNNMPSIRFEVDPNIETAPPLTNFSTLTFLPDSQTFPGLWSDYIDATTTGRWVGSGDAFPPGTDCTR